MKCALLLYSNGVGWKCNSREDVCDCEKCDEEKKEGKN